jgi:predicted ATPase/class 3 adenylate cyclase
MLPTGTVTLLLADIEGSTRLWESQPETMAAAVKVLDRTLAEFVPQNNGVRPVEQGEGDSFVIAFARASDAITCALALQRAPLSPIRLRMGLHTGEVQLRDEGNYIGPTINKTGRLRDLAHGGQTVMSGATTELVADWLPPDAWLTDLGRHPLRGVARAERVVQLCHPDLDNAFPPLRTAKTITSHNLPSQLTSFVGRGEEIKDALRLLTDNRLVTLTGAGGVGKTRLALQVAAMMVDEQEYEVRFVDLAPVTDPDNVAVTAARAFGLPDRGDRSPTQTIARFIGNRRMLVILDNCEHLLDACADLATALLIACPELSLLATSREPTGVAGEVTWRVPSLSITDEAVTLFADRARRARPDFTVTEDNATALREICAQLDGMPLAIELAAARVRALSLTEIAAGLRDRFRLLTGGARTATPRQQTLLGSVDWSHAMLTSAERVLFRRLAVFAGGFDLDAAEVVAAGGEVQQSEVLQLLTMLVDKSLVLAEQSADRTRYRLLETMRQYAFGQLEGSGEVEAVRRRHGDHYTAFMDMLDSGVRATVEQPSDLGALEFDNLRAAFALRADDSDPDLLLRAARGAAWLVDYQLAERLADAAIRAGAAVKASLFRAQILSFLGRGPEADAVLENIGELGLTEEDYSRTAFLRGITRLFTLVDPTGAKRLIDEAVPRTPDSARSCLDAFFTVYWAAMGRPGAALASADSITWDDLPDVAARMTAWATTVAYGDTGMPAQAVVAAEAGYRFPARGSFLVVTDAHAGALILAGRIADAEEVAKRMVRRAAGFPNVQLTQISNGLNGRTALAAGRLQSACFLLGLASDTLAASGDTNGAGYRIELPRTTAFAMRDWPDEATDSLDRLQSLRHPGWRYLDYEWAIAHGWVAACQGSVAEAIATTLVGAETARANGQRAAEVMCLQTATQFGDGSTADRLRELATIVSGPRAGVAAHFAVALNASDAAGLVAVSEQFERIGDLVAAVDAAAHAAAVFDRDGKHGPASKCASRAVLVARQWAISTPALQRIRELASG